MGEKKKKKASLGRETRQHVSFLCRFFKKVLESQAAQTHFTREGCNVMNDFPVTWDLVMRTGLWDRQGANIASRYKEMYGLGTLYEKYITEICER